jgi:membrane-bound serine protease (ClpP class)
MVTRIRLWQWAWFSVVLAALLMGVGLAQTTRAVYYVTVDNALSTPAAGLVRRAITEAEAADAIALVVEVRDGGSLRAAWPLAREIEAADVPVVTYIAPRGTRSGPVGTLLVTASHVAVMAPDSEIGFAQPLTNVPAGFGDETQQLVVDEVTQQVAGWARARGRNADWVERAVQRGATIRAEDARALDPPVIDLVATNDELLTSLQGRRVTLANGEERTLDTLGAPVRQVTPSIWESLGQLLALPTVAFILFVLGGIAIYLEFATPGIGIPGITGGILVLVALVGFVLGEVRPLAVVLLAAGLVLVGLEHAVMSHGGFTLAGLVLVVLGALYLVDPARTPGVGVSLLTIGGVAVLLGGAAAGMLTLAIRVRSRPPSTGQEALIGQLAEVRQSLAPEGFVYVNGALWSAWTDQGPLQAGQLVEVVAVDGLRLYVRSLEDEPAS